MKRLLLITFHFPPDAAIGAVRPAELTKYLSYSGWEPTILSVDEKYYSQLDTSRYSALGHDVVRTRKIASINEIYLFFKRALSPINQNDRLTARGKEWFATKESGQSHEGIKSRLLRYYNSLLIYLPDKEIGWFFFAVLKGLKLIRQKKIEAIFTTSPPHSVHLSGLALKIFTKKPWIADFRDPWEVELKPRRSRSTLSDVIEKRMELAVVRNADRVISVTGAMTDRFKRLYPDHADKFVTIPNGYDSDDLSKYWHSEKYDSFTITYVGSLYFGLDPFLLFTAISQLINEGNIARDSIRVRMIGDCRASDGKSVEAMVKELGLNDVIVFVDKIPHHEALKEIAISHVLILMAPCQPLQIPGKVYEYIGLRAKILAVCEDGATKDLMQAYPLAKVVSPDSMSGLKEAIVSFYRERNEDNNNDKKLSDFAFEKYERKTIAEEVARLLSQVSA